jgi:DNA-binding NarL/FixJ family response regulator
MKPRWKVVVVDDHAPSRAAVAEAITAQGGQVLGNGSRADDVAHLVGKHRPDVLVMAVGLPDGDGVEAARQLMAAGSCPVVLLTSHTESHVAERAIAAGVLASSSSRCGRRSWGPPSTWRCRGSVS